MYKSVRLGVLLESTLVLFRSRFKNSEPTLTEGVVQPSVAEPEPPLLGRLRTRSRSRFFCWSEPGDGAALVKAAPAPAASFRQAKKKSLVLVSNMTLRAV